MAEGYNAAQIHVLKGLEAVRHRPAMYIGDIGIRGLHHLVYEVVDNAVDEALAGFCDTVNVTILSDDEISAGSERRPEHFPRVLQVLQHVHEHRDVKRPIGRFEELLPNVEMRVQFPRVGDSEGGNLEANALESLFGT